MPTVQRVTISRACTRSRLLPFVLLLGLVFSTVIGWCDEVEEEAAKQIQKIEGRIERDEKLPGKPIVSVYLGYTPVTDGDLKRLLPFKHLRHLELGQTKITDKGLKELATLANLKDLPKLDLRDSGITDGGVKNLTAFKNLQLLNLTRTKITLVNNG